MQTTIARPVATRSARETGRLKVLLSAYACEPGKGSEPAVGWNWVLQIARHHEVWVITRSNNHPAIEAAGERRLPNVHWCYFDLPRWARFWKRGERGLHLYYLLWQLGAYFRGRGIHRKVGFDLVHHLTFGQYWTPSLLGLLGPPFVWGPVGGGESAPRSFWWDFSGRGKLFEIARSAAQFLAAFNPILRSIARRSAFALATTEQTSVRLKKLGARTVIVHPQFGMTGSERESFKKIETARAGPFRVISIGRQIHWKGFHLGLRAFAKLLQVYPDSEYWLINNGPELPRLRALAGALGIGSHVTFWGKLGSLEEVYEKLSQCDVLVHPALHEAFGNVCLEAMAAGRPVVCLDLGGPALQVTRCTGIKVPAESPQQAIAELAAALCRLARNPQLRTRLGNEARRRVLENFDWDSKGDFMMQVYATAISHAHAADHGN